MISTSKSPRFTTLMFGAAFIYLVGLLFHLPALFFMASALIVAPAVSYAMAAAGLRQITAERRVPSRLWPDERVVVELRIHNEAWLPKCLLLIDEHLPEGLAGDEDEPPSCVVPMLWAEPFVHRYSLTAVHRGRYVLPPVVATAVDTFDLFRARRAVGPSDQLLVYPRIVPLKDHGLHSPSIHGVVRRRQAMPEGTDFRSTREYQPGDDLRRVHWRSTARRRKMIVMEFEEPATADLFIVLDVGRGAHRGAGKDTTLETGVTLAASVIDFELDRGNAVGLLLDASERTVLRLTTDRHRLLTFQEALALVEADGPASLAETLALVPHEVERGKQVLVISARDDSEAIGAAADLARNGYGVAYAYLDPAGYPGVPEREGAGAGLLNALRGVGAMPFRIRRGAIAAGLNKAV